jgi:hypothetical protein
MSKPIFALSMAIAPCLVNFIFFMTGPEFLIPEKAACIDSYNNVLPLMTPEGYQGEWQSQNVNTYNLQGCKENEETRIMAPFIHEPLPDISISCEYFLTLMDYAVFGNYVAEGMPRNPIVVQDHFYLPSGFAGLDGVYYSNVPDITISTDTIQHLNMCNIGVIERIFLIQEVTGAYVRDTQTIYVIDVDLFSLDDIEWPDQVVYFDSCQVSVPSPNTTGMPLLQLNPCSQPGSSFSDLTFSHPDYCRVIRRTWTVIDWCQTIPNTQVGRWSFHQYIYVTNNVAPTIQISVCETLTVCTIGESCTYPLVLQAEGTDDCQPELITWKYAIDEGNNQTIDFAGSGNTLQRELPIGTSKISWEAKDGCGNISTCHKLVHIRDCKAPSGIVFRGLAAGITSPMNMVTVYVDNFNNGSYDNCSPASALQFSFSTDILDKNKTYTCSEVGTQPVQIWVTDLQGNQSIVQTFIEIQDNEQVCKNLNSVMVAGMVRTVDLQPLPSTRIIIEGGETYQDQLTNGEGKYCFTHLGKYNDYQIAGERNEEPMRGVSTLDLVMLQRHILGITPFKNPVDWLAADVDGSKKINTSDLVLLRKLILGLKDTFPENKPWIFVKEGQQYLDKSNPWIENPDIHYNNLDSSRQSANFIGIKVGDVNHDYSSDNYEKLLDSRSVLQPEIMIEDKILRAGEIASVEIRGSKLRNILAKQFTLELTGSLEYHGFESKGLPLMSDQIAFVQKNGKTYITCAFHDLAPLSLEDGEVLFTFWLKADKDARASKNIHLSQDIAQCKVYFEDFSNLPLKLKFTSQHQPESAFVKQNHPNPFKEETMLSYQLTTGGLVQITVYDGAGKLIYQESQQGNAGVNTWLLSSKELGESRGILYVKIKSEELNEVVRIMRIE